MKKFLTIIGAMLFFVGFAAAAHAEQITVEADGYYTIGDGLDENISAAKERARADALRNASEQAAVFVESLTVVKDGMLSSDEIRTLSANILHLQGEPKFKIIPVADDVIRYQCHITAVADTSAVTAEMLRDKKSLSQMTDRNRELEREIARLNDEMATLKAQYRAADNDAERQRLRELARQNDNNFTAAQLNNDGARAYEENRFDRAAELFTKAIALNPQNANAYYNRGNAYAQLGHYAEALRDYDRALQINPSLDAAKINRDTVSRYIYQ